MLHEPATTLTDYLLALECAWFVFALARSGTAGFVRWAFMVLFGSIALASLAGGTVHGFFPDPTSGAQRSLWLLTLLAIGITAASMLALAARLAAPRLHPVTLAALAGSAWLTYAAVVVWVSRAFVVAIIAYLPAAILLMAAFVHRLRGARAPGAVAGIAGVALALLGAVGQQAGIGLHPLYFDHNAVYHVVQGVALYLLYRCAIGMMSGDGRQVI